MVARAIERILQFGLERIEPLLRFFRIDVAFSQQLLGIDLPHGAMFLDRPVHLGLRERRLVAFVVAVAPVAEHVDDHILVELLAELPGQAHRADARFRIVAVDVEDRRLHRLGYVGGVDRGARGLRTGGEADLIVDDQMNRYAGSVALELRQIQRLGHHALSGECSVAV